MILTCTCVKTTHLMASWLPTSQSFSTFWTSAPCPPRNLQVCMRHTSNPTTKTHTCRRKCAGLHVCVSTHIVISGMSHFVGGLCTLNYTKTKGSIVLLLYYKSIFDSGMITQSDMIKSSSCAPFPPHLSIALLSLYLTLSFPNPPSLSGTNFFPCSDSVPVTSEMFTS